MTIIGPSKERLHALNRALPFLIAMIAGVVCYSIFLRRGVGLSVIGYIVSPAERVMNGEVPYRDFLFNYTPGILWVNALLMTVAGPSLIVIRLGLLFFRMSTLIMLFIVAKRLTGAWPALVAVALALAWIGHRQVFNTYPDHYLMPFALLALNSMLSHNQRGGARPLLLCGAAIGVVFVFKHNVGLYLLAAAIASVASREALLIPDARKASRLSAMAGKSALQLLGFVVVAGAMAAYLAVHHALGAMLDHFIHFAAAYRGAGAVGLPRPGQVAPSVLALAVVIGGAALVLHKARRFFPSYLLVVLVLGSGVLLIPGKAYALKESALASVAYFPAVTFAGSIAVALRQVRKAARSEGGPAKWWRDNGPVVIAGLFALAVYLEVFPRADNYHLVRVLPVVMLFFLVCLARSLPAVAGYLERRLQTHPHTPFLVAALPLFFLFSCGLFASWRPEFDSKGHFRNSTELTLERGGGILVEPRQAKTIESLVRIVENNSEAGDFIFSFSRSGSSLYFLANRRNPSRLVWWNSIGIRKGEHDALLRLVADGVPKLIVVQDNPANKGIRDFVSSYYNLIGTVADKVIYSRIR